MGPKWIMNKKNVIVFDLDFCRHIDTVPEDSLGIAALKSTQMFCEMKIKSIRNHRQEGVKVNFYQNWARKRIDVEK
jgi:hypothetical protein